MYPYFPSQLITTQLEHFILLFPSHSSRQANSTPRRTPQCKYIQITKLKTLHKRKPCTAFQSQLPWWFYLYIGRVKQSLGNFQALGTEVTVVAIGELVMNCWHLCCHPGASDRKGNTFKCSLDRMASHLSSVINYSSNRNS